LSRNAIESPAIKVVVVSAVDLVRGEDERRRLIYINGSEVSFSVNPGPGNCPC
jgi:hypothetical protein